MSPAQPFSWHDITRYGHAWVYLLKWPVYFVAGWGAIYYRRWRKTHIENIAQGWPSVEGVIVRGEAKPIPKTSKFHAVLVYTYLVNEYRSGKYDHDFSSEAEADDFVRQMKDKRVQIRYKESNPDKSVLEQSVVEQHVLLATRYG